MLLSARKIFPRLLLAPPVHCADLPRAWPAPDSSRARRPSLMAHGEAHVRIVRENSSATCNFESWPDQRIPRPHLATDSHYCAGASSFCTYCRYTLNTSGHGEVSEFFSTRQSPRTASRTPRLAATEYATNRSGSMRASFGAELVDHRWVTYV
jgi:hypothetical protein